MGDLGQCMIFPGLSGSVECTWGLVITRLGLSNSGFGGFSGVVRVLRGLGGVFVTVDLGS